MTIYIAGRYESKGRLQEIRQRVECLGHQVVSTWLDEPESEYPTEMDSNAIRACALRDLVEIATADVLLLDTYDEDIHGGREWEGGFGFGHPHLRVMLVGPRRNIFHTLVPMQFKSWEEALQWLAR